MSKLLNDQGGGGVSRTMEMRDQGKRLRTVLVVAGWLDWVISEVFPILHDSMTLCILSADFNEFNAE